MSPAMLPDAHLGRLTTRGETPRDTFLRQAGSYMPASTWPKSNSKPGKTADGTGVENA